MQTAHSPEQIGQLGEDLYRRQLRNTVMPQHKGKFLVIDVRSGEYEIDEDDLTATHRLQAQVPDAEIYGLRIGYKSAYTLAGGLVEDPA